MRLTLRTLLAYMDDILKPGDAEELAVRIDENKGARNLIQHIRSCTRRMRLRAPRLGGKGMGLDPNSVAEYLDNTLGQERTPDFERVCLESDVHLAEVASCHQILTLVLGEPAEVDRRARKRIYRLIEQGRDEAGTKSKSQKRKAKAKRIGDKDVRVDPAEERPAASAAVAAPPVERPDATEEIPEYMQVGGRSRIIPLALTVCLAIGIFVGVLAMMGKLGPLMAMFGGKSQDEKSVSQNDGTTGAGEGSNNTPDENKNNKAGQPVEGNPVNEQDGKRQKVDNPTVNQANKQPAEQGNQGKGRPVVNVPPKQADVDKNKTKPRQDQVKKPVAPEKKAPPKKAQANPSNVAKNNAAKKAAVKPPVNAAPLQATIGRYFSDRQFLARFDPGQRVWKGMAVDSNVRSGDMLLSLPAYRPQLLLAPGIKITLVDATSASLARDANSNISQLNIEYGKAIIRPVGAAGAQLALNLGGRQGTVRFVDAQAAMVLEVIRWLPPGTNTARIATQVFVSGQVEWREAPGLPQPQRVDLANQGQPFLGSVHRSLDDGPAEIRPVYSFPEWVNPKRGFRGLDESAAQDLLPHLQKDGPLNLLLLEQVDHRLLEVRSLAVRGLSQLNILDPMVQALGKPEFKTQWATQLQFLRAALARGGASARELQVALEKNDPIHAAALQQMIVGYSPAGLQNGGAEELVTRLESERMNLRVLAWLNLKNITNKGHLFQPGRPVAVQKKQRKKWSDELKSNRIVYAKAPTPFKPLPKPKPAPVPQKGPGF